MKKGFLLSFIIIFLILQFAPEAVYGTHNRAGELTYAFIAPNTLQVTIATWTKASSMAADRDSLFIHWGDGSPDIEVARVNGPIGASGVPNGVLLGNDIKYNLYVGTHTYPGAPPPPNNFYIVSMTDPNRNSAIINISGGNSVNVQFYIEDSIFFPSNIQDVGYDHSPICLNPPVDFAYVGDTFLHNPAAYDPDGDSISFRMIIPLQAEGLIVPGYVSPTLIPGASANNKDSLDIHTGLYTWATPQYTGIYNVAFLISEYRRGFLLGTIDRDMQIIVLDDTTAPPVVKIPKDTCVRAGDLLIGNVTGTDPNPAHSVTLTGYGGPLAGDPKIFPDSLSPATFTNPLGATPITGNPAEGVFQWNTVCRDIREQPYQIVFKAQNNNINPKIDLKTWEIQVIAPPPLDLTDTVSQPAKDILLHWQNPYKCDSIGTFKGFSIWRRIGSNPFVPAYCETGLAGRGYTMIASGIFDTTYTDQTAVRGEYICYRILANFAQTSPNGLYEYDAVVSVPSNEYCIYLPYDVPVITTASVLQTDKAAGQMFVAWIKPKTGGTNLDTILDPPPYRFDLYRGTGLNFNSPVLIHSTSSNTFAGLSDTTYTDTNINTADSAYSYQVRFYSDNDTVGSSSQASSVYLNANPTDSKNILSWAFNVPWLEDSFQIFRRDYTTGGIFKYIATDTTIGSHTYIDAGLINDTNYCYYVKAFGHYTSTYIAAPLVDSSEIKCATPVDTIPPCPPIVTVTNNCGSTTVCDSVQYVNYLSWTEPDSCGFNTVEYRIYFSPDTGGAMMLIDSMYDTTGTYSYKHMLNSTNLAGCYIVTAVSNHGYESHKTNQVCIGDCPNYQLPNTFTPNGDGHNDLFHPYTFCFISKVDFKIFTRWGEKVFETNDPNILWDGKDQKSGKELSDGVYFYAGYYYENTQYGEVRKPLPQKNGGGFIHLIRDK
jgi:gliding motility-associated-like protein